VCLSGQKRKNNSGITWYAGDKAKRFEQQMSQELQLLAQVVDATPDDVITRPGEGIGIYSPGHKHLAEIGLLVRW
jgi:hypothetical protein